jgi:hypothetical protein
LRFNHEFLTAKNAKIAEEGTWMARSHEPDSLLFGLSVILRFNHEFLTAKNAKIAEEGIAHSGGCSTNIAG